MIPFIIIVFFIFCIPRQTVLYYAKYRADRILNHQVTVNDDSHEHTLITLTKWVSSQYKDKKESVRRPIKSKIINYLSLYSQYYTSRHIPSVFRIPRGAIELITADVEEIGKGQCDSASRMLILLLKGAGYRSKQLDMYNPFTAHTVVEAITADNKSILIDPYNAVIAKHKNKLIGIRELNELVLQNKPIDTLFLRLQGNNRLDFYAHLVNGGYSYQGEGGKIRLILPHEGEYSVGKSKLLGYFFYIGSRFDSSWTRTINITEDTVLEFVFNKPINTKLVNANLPYEIKGHVLTWHLIKGQSLKLYDYLTPFSLFSKNRFQEIDKIRVKRLI